MLRKFTSIYLYIYIECTKKQTYFTDKRTLQNIKSDFNETFYTYRL